jgi:glycerophosphoryl diester phosphodiesterase
VVHAPDWLTARPIAHRGQHDRARGIIENMPAAAQAAVSGNFGIECDIQLTADGEAMVHHDDALGRLTDGTARLADMSATDIKAVRFKGSTARILTLGELCELVAGRSPLLLELKSRFDNDLRLAKRTAELVARYSGRAAIMSFDPDLIEAVRNASPDLTRGIVAERHYSDPEWDGLPFSRKQSLAWLLHARRSRPQFLAYSVQDLPAAPALIARRLFGLPLLTWTVRSENMQRRAARWADQIIFEGWRP